MLKMKLYAILAMTMLGLSTAATARPMIGPDFADLVDRTSPVVVNISTKTKRRQPRRNEVAPFPGQRRDGSALGSGFIVSADGYIITNAHVVEDAEEIVVKLTDGRQLEAKVVGEDEQSDVAVLRVQATNLPVAKIGNSAKMRVGNWVLAIGSPFGFEQTVTAGIISAKSRSVGREQYVPFIQTQVPINPGNSGGPLFNLDGEVIGVNSMIYSKSGGYQGMSFAIPSDLAMSVFRQIKNGGEVKRGWLGVAIENVKRETAKSFGLSKPEGAVVLRVTEGSPADKAGIEIGDVIVKFNGRPVPNMGALPPLVGITPVGSVAEVVIYRDGKRKTVDVTLGELDPDDLSASRGGASGDRASAFGMTVGALSADERKALKTRVGVIVRRVKGGAAEDAGIRKGDVILMLDRRHVNSVDDFRNIARNTERERVPVLVERNGDRTFLLIDAD